MLSACDVAELPASDERVQVYDARTGDWFDGVGSDVGNGDTFLEEGRVLRVTAGGVELRGYGAIRDLAEADATWVAESAHRLPSGEDWVLVLGASDEAGHWQLSDVAAGERFAFQGRVFETADVDADGALEVRWSGDVLGRVVNTFVRLAPEVIDAEVAYDDGTTDTLTGTPNHPFWVDAVRDYLPLGELEVGTALHVQGGGEALLVSKTWRQGDFEVFDFEVHSDRVDRLHNFYVRGEGSDAAGVLVHNSTSAASAAGDAVEEGQTVYRVWGGESGAGGRYWSRTDPSSVDDYRDVAGLPDGNSGQFVSEGRLVDATGVEVTPGGAAPLNGNAGGIDEIKIPNPESQVELTGVSGVNPEY